MNKIGVECLTNQEVVNIESKNNQIKRVITNDSSYDADIVVSNADPTYFYKRILKHNPSKLSNNPLILSHSMSLFVLYF